MRPSRWGNEGPPPEAYSRVTDPERFRPLHAVAEEMAVRLEAAFDVERIEGLGLDSELERIGTARSPIRLVPRSRRAAPILLAFTPFPGVLARLGRWHLDAFPVCGCDACDESAEEQIERFTWLVEQVTNGRFRESITLPVIGDAWLEVEFWSPDGSRRKIEGRLDRAQARGRLAEADRAAHDWEPWPKRPQPQSR